MEDIEAGLRFCRASGWNQLERTGFLQANPAGCQVAVEDGAVAGTVTTLRFEDRFSWISMLLVTSGKARTRDWDGAATGRPLRVLDEVRCVRLDATPAGKAVYDRYGFRDEYPLVRMRADQVALAVAAGGVRRLEARDVEAVERLDRAVFGAKRTRC